MHYSYYIIIISTILYYSSLILTKILIKNIANDIATRLDHSFYNKSHKGISTKSYIPEAEAGPTPFKHVNIAIAPERLGNLLKAFLLCIRTAFSVFILTRSMRLGRYFSLWKKNIQKYTQMKFKVIISPTYNV